MLGSFFDLLIPVSPKLEAVQKLGKLSFIGSSPGHFEPMSTGITGDLLDWLKHDRL